MPGRRPAGSCGLPKRIRINAGKLELNTPFLPFYKKSVVRKPISGAPARLDRLRSLAKMG